MTHMAGAPWYGTQVAKVDKKGGAGGGRSDRSGKKSARDAERPRSKKSDKARKRRDDAAGPGGHTADRRPDVVVVADVAVFAVDHGRLAVLLVERERRPDKGRWAVPGAVVEPDEPSAAAAARAVTARTGIAEPFDRLEPFAVFDAPARDPRTRVVSAGFVGLTGRARPPAGGRHARGRWWPVGRLWDDDRPSMAFDHRAVVAAALGHLRARLEQADLATALVEEPFTLGELRRAYEAVWGTALEPANFRRKVLATPGMVVQTAGTRTVGTGRPADLYLRGPGGVFRPPMPRPV